MLLWTTRARGTRPAQARTAGCLLHQNRSAVMEVFSLKKQSCRLRSRPGPPGKRTTRRALRRIGRDERRDVVEP
eukprot:3861797-Prymnesium_polylepis.1